MNTLYKLFKNQCWIPNTNKIYNFQIKNMACFWFIYLFIYFLAIYILNWIWFADCRCLYNGRCLQSNVIGQLWDNGTQPLGQCRSLAVHFLLPKNNVKCIYVYIDYWLQLNTSKFYIQPDAIFKRENKHEK